MRSYKYPCMLSMRRLGRQMRGCALLPSIQLRPVYYESQRSPPHSTATDCQECCTLLACTHQHHKQRHVPLAATERGLSYSLLQGKGRMSGAVCAVSGEGEEQTSLATLRAQQTVARFPRYARFAPVGYSTLAQSRQQKPFLRCQGRCCNLHKAPVYCKVFETRVCHMANDNLRAACVPTTATVSSASLTPSSRP